MEKPSYPENERTFSSEREGNRFDRFRQKTSVFASARATYYHSYRRDPLARLLIDRLRLSPLGAVGVGFGLVSITYLLGLVLAAVLHQEIAGITQTALDWFYDFSLIPLTFGYYTWISIAPAHVMVKMRQNGVSLKTEGAMEDFGDKTVRQWLHHPALFVFASAAALTTAGLYFQGVMAHATTWGGGEANYWVLGFAKVPVTWLIPWYMVCVIFIKQTLLVVRLRKLLSDPNLLLDLRNHDRCGGLKAISEYLFHFNTFLMACGFGFVLLYARARRYGHGIPAILVHVALAVYLFLSLFYFFFPLHPIHRAMVKWKRELQRKLPVMEFFPLWAWTPDTIGKFILSTIAPLLLIGLFLFL